MEANIRQAWRVLSSAIQRLVVRWKSTGVSEEHALVFGVEEWATQEIKMNQASSKTALLAAWFFRNVGWLRMDYTTLQPRRQNFSWPPLWEPHVCNKKATFSKHECVSCMSGLDYRCFVDSTIYFPVLHSIPPGFLRLCSPFSPLWELYRDILTLLSGVMPRTVSSGSLWILLWYGVCITDQNNVHNIDIALYTG
jgi:hypothetical protein